MSLRLFAALWLGGIALGFYGCIRPGYNWYWISGMAISIGVLAAVWLQGH